MDRVSLDETTRNRAGETEYLGLRVEGADGYDGTIDSSRDRSRGRVATCALISRGSSIG